MAEKIRKNKKTFFMFELNPENVVQSKSKILAYN
jgi:hypothetical protein